MDIQRLRNLTTGRLHTGMDDIYKDIDFIVGESGVMTHMLPNAARALESYLRTIVTDPRFWDGQYDVSHVGQIEVPPMTKERQDEFWTRYEALPSPFGN